MEVCKTFASIVVYPILFKQLRRLQHVVRTKTDCGRIDNLTMEYPPEHGQRSMGIVWVVFVCVCECVCSYRTNSTLQKELYTQKNAPFIWPLPQSPASLCLVHIKTLAGSLELHTRRHKLATHLRTRRPFRDFSPLSYFALDTSTRHGVVPRQHLYMHVFVYEYVRTYIYI